MSVRIVFLLWVLLISTVCCAQDWRIPYEAAVSAYQHQQYNEAVTHAELAVKLSMDADKKSRAYSMQILTASALEAGVADKALPYCDQEISLFLEIEADGKNMLEAHSKKGQLLVMTKAFGDAARAFQALTVMTEKTKGKTIDYYRAVAMEAEALLFAKDLVKSKELYAQCLTPFRESPEGGEDYLYALYNAAYVEVQLKEHSRAAVKLTELISLLEQNELTQLPEYEEARKMLSLINSTTATAPGENEVFMLAEDQLRKNLQAALKFQHTDVKQATQMYEACERVIAENGLVNNNSLSCYLNYARFLYALKQYPNADKKLMLAKSHAAKLSITSGAERGALLMLEADLLLAQDRAKDILNLYGLALQDFGKETPEFQFRQTRWVAEQLLQHRFAPGALDILTRFRQAPSFQNISVTDKIILEKLRAASLIETRQVHLLLKELKTQVSSEQNPSLKQGYLLLLAQGEKESGDFNEALLHLEQAAALTSDGFLDGELYFETARLQQQLGNYKDAEIAYRRAVEKAASSTYAQTLVPQVYNSFATFYMQLGNYAAAEKLFVSLLAGNQEHAVFYNAVRQNFASLYQQTGKYAQAKKLLKEAVAIDRQTLGESHPDYAIALQNLASVYQKTGQLDSALILYESALHIDRAFYGEQSLAYAAKMANLGAVQQDIGNYDKALTFYEHALQVRKEKLSPDHPDYAFNLYSIGFLLYRTGQSQKALPYFQETATLYLRQIRDVFPVLSDYERTAFYNKIQPVIQGYEMFMVENATTNPSLAGQLLNFRLETKALLLNASIKVRNQILKSDDRDLINQFAVWQHAKEQLAFLYSLSLEEQRANEALLTEIHEKANTLEKSLSLKSEAFASAYGYKVPDWKEIRASLRPSEAAIEMVRTTLPGDSVVYAAILLRPETVEPSLILLNNGRYLEEKAFTFYINAIRFQLHDDRSYGAFWKNIDQFLKGINVVHFSADGVFNKINPLTLYDPEAKQYVIDRMQLDLASNLKELLERSEDVTASNHALLLGFPDYRLDSKQNMNGDATRSVDVNLYYEVLKNGLSDLPGTAEEVQEIERTLKSQQWNVTSHLREEAREEVVKQAKSPAILHIATHGFFISPTTGTSRADLSNIDNQILLRSGLLLAGSEKYLAEKADGKTVQQGEDGVLTAYEIINLDLDSTSMVVLSACETGKGDIRNGEGVYGLQRAFVLAGAGRVIMSLWKVDDASTRDLMTMFYDAWTSSGSHSDAFYKTQLEMKKTYPHPYHWGAFVVTGNR